MGAPVGPTLGAVAGGVVGFVIGAKVRSPLIGALLGTGGGYFLAGGTIPNPIPNPFAQFGQWWSQTTASLTPGGGSSPATPSGSPDTGSPDDPSLASD